MHIEFWNFKDIYFFLIYHLLSIKRIKLYQFEHTPIIIVILNSSIYHFKRS